MCLTETFVPRKSRSQTMLRLPADVAGQYFARQFNRLAARSSLIEQYSVPKFMRFGGSCRFSQGAGGMRLRITVEGAPQATIEARYRARLDERRQECTAERRVFCTGTGNSDGDPRSQVREMRRCHQNKKNRHTECVPGFLCRPANRMTRSATGCASRMHPAASFPATAEINRPLARQVY
jgi:hypothetical protein